MASTALAKLKAGAARGRAYGREQLSKAKQTFASRQTRLKGEITQLKSGAAAAGNGALVLTGAAAAGLYRARAPEYMREPLGIDGEVLTSLVLAGAGIGMKRPMLVYFASGMLAPYVSEYVEEMSKPEMTLKEVPAAAGAE